jgi:Xaa-Pro aminopeptidase
MITQKEYKNRRDKLLKSLKKNSIAVVHSALYKTRSNDTDYPYRQDSNFYYLTGFKEDESCLMLVKGEKLKSILFVAKKDPTQELWNGKRLGEEKAKEKFLVDEVYEIEKFDEIFSENFKNIRNLYYDFSLNYLRFKAMKRLSKGVTIYRDIKENIQKMRLIKSSSEIKLIKKALAITTEAHHKLMKLDKVGMYEYQLQAKLESIFKSNGAYSDAYTSIVAGGNNANTLHYIENSKKLKSGDLILIDAGCEYEYYASDITRTIPVSNKFTKAQRKLYNMVLDVQLKIISMIKPQVLRSDLQKASEELLCQGMIDLGILKGKKEKLLEQKAHKKYFPHGIGHWMGIDVHDEAPYRDEKFQEIPLKAGMVLTIEPGIYCDENDKTIPKKYRGIGIRIEDNILVTKDGCDNLSNAVRKTVQEIESI